MAISVTRHDGVSGGGNRNGGGLGAPCSDSGPPEWRYLSSGIDTLDLGLYVEWGERWPVVSRLLASGKKRAEGTKGVLWSDGTSEPCLILAGGKPPMYRYHLQLTHAHVFVQQRGCLVPFAVRLGLEDLGSAVDNLGEAVRQYWAGRSFEDRYKVESIKLGMGGQASGGTNGNP
jgi:hypothetical protein